MSARIALSSLALEAGIQGFVLWLQNIGGSACIPGSVYSWPEWVRVAMSTRAHVVKPSTSVGRYYPWSTRELKGCRSRGERLQIPYPVVTFPCWQDGDN